MRDSRHSSLRKKNGELAPIDELVELDARARRLGRDRVRERREPLDAGDDDLEVLAARGEDLLVDELVARVGGECLGVQVLLADRRQDAHDHHVVVALARALVGVVEARPDLLLELREHAALEAPRRDVDLDVELAELGDEVGVGEAVEHARVRERRIAGVVGEVELDLEPDRAAI
jgi:hypothetical protein